MWKSVHPKLDKKVDGSILFCKRCEMVLGVSFCRDVREFEVEIFWVGQQGHEKNLEMSMVMNCAPGVKTTLLKSSISL